MRVWKVLLFMLGACLLLPGMALADAAPPPQTTLAFPTDQVWTLLAGALAPLAAYVLNYIGPHTDEKVKGLVQAVVAAIAGGVGQAISAGPGTVGFNNTTLQFVLSAIAAAVFAHGAYKAAGINTYLGGGRNKA